MKTQRLKTKSSKNSAPSQVRIIGGQFKRQLVPFINAEGLRPSPDRLRETLFNWIQFDLHDASVIDVCAGSGVLGFEALSRGAKHVTFIELNSKQAQLIAQTAENFKLTSTNFRLYTGDALIIIPDLNPSEATTIKNINESKPKQSSSLKSTYHLVFIDPPYDLNLWIPLLNKLIVNQLVSTETLFYIEDRRELKETLQGLEQSYTVLKESKVGQIFASLIQISI